MVAKSYFQRLLALAMTELSDPIDSTKMDAAWKDCQKKISKSRLAYQFWKENP